jgi:hypothetical protein
MKVNKINTNTKCYNHSNNDSNNGDDDIKI